MITDVIVILRYYIGYLMEMNQNYYFSIFFIFIDIFY